MKRWETIIKRFNPDDKLIGAEIGVFEAKNSKQLLTGLPNLFLYMIDRWCEYSPSEKSGDVGAYMTNHDAEKWEMIYQKAVRKISPFAGRYKIIKRGSLSAVKRFDDNFFDFVFIDADHSYEGCLADIKAWLPKIKKGGYLCGHDYTRSGVKKSVDEVLKNVELDDDKTWFYRV